MNLLMISGDRQLIKNEKGPFYYLMREFSKYWEMVNVICPGAGIKKNELFGNVNLYGVRPLVKDIVRLAEEIYHQSKYQVMTVHDYPPFRHSCAARKINQRLSVPYMTELHHIVGYPKAADFKEWLLKIFSEIALAPLTKKAKAIRVVNKHQVPKFLAIAGVPQEKIVYLPSFYLDHHVFYPQNLEKKYDLLFVGRLAKNKGLDLLLEIFALYKKEYPNFKAAIVGEGIRNKACQRRVRLWRKLGLMENVEFLGWLPDSQSLAKVYNQSKILLITSYNEGGPRVGLEAMAVGLPVISTKVGVMLDIIKDGENGFLANWSANDFVEKIGLLGEQVNMRLGNREMEKIIESVKQFDYQAMIKNYAEQLKNLA